MWICYWKKRGFGFFGGLDIYSGYDIEDASKIIAGARKILRQTEEYSRHAEVQLRRATYATSFLYRKIEELDKKYNDLSEKHEKLIRSQERKRYRR